MVRDIDSTFDLAVELRFQWRFLRALLKICFGVGLLYFLLESFAMPPGNIGSPTSSAMTTARQIGLMMVAYANDNGAYPDGKSSTEVFQKLLDGRYKWHAGNYCVDPTIFYIGLPGKTKPVMGQKLKPENVCWDVTSGVDPRDPDRLPIVFLTATK